MVGPDRPSLSVVKLTISRMNERKQFFDKALIYRLLKKSRDSFLGKDRDSMTKFFSYGNQIKQKGGTFLYTHCAASTKLTSVHLQHPIEFQLVKQYGKILFFMDTTANTTKHLLKNFPACGIDFFG